MKILSAILLLTSTSLSFPDTHYVSHEGSDEWPYTSWVTAADSIGDAMDAAESGDTVRVAPGTWDENVVMKPEISLVGAGMDSTVINGIYDQDVIKGADGCLVEGFHLVGQGIQSISIGVDCDLIDLIVRNNKITDCANAIDGWTSSQVIGNLITENGVGIWFTFGGSPLIADNIIINNRYENLHCDFASPTIVNNIVAHAGRLGDGMHLVYTGTTIIRNNLVFGNGGYGIALVACSDGIVENNTIVGNDDAGVTASEYSPIIRNNIIIENRYGIYSFKFGEPLIYYNDIWGNETDYASDETSSCDPLEGNISANPMFIGEEDFHLQFASPCIDAGDPSILDVDSTRSDMGAYGGPGGESYTYLDLAPSPPESLRASVVDTTVLLSWRANTESDLSHYLIYRDTLQGFPHDTTNLIGMVTKPDTGYQDTTIVYGCIYYYKLTAVDTTGNEGEPSEEIALSVSVEECESQREILCTLLGIYPNPFTSTVAIEYQLNNPLEVVLIVYNPLGQEMKTLLERREKAGRYIAVWDGRNDEGMRVGSGIYFCRLSAEYGKGQIERVKKLILIRRHS